MKKVYDFFGGRRYFFAEQILLLATGLLIVKKITSNNWVDICIWTAGIYVGGNILQKISEAKFEKKDSK